MVKFEHERLLIKSEDIREVTQRLLRFLPTTRPRKDDEQWVMTRWRNYQQARALVDKELAKDGGDWRSEQWRMFARQLDEDLRDLAKEIAALINRRCVEGLVFGEHAPGEWGWKRTAQEGI